MNSKQKSLIIKLVIGLVIIMGIVVAIMLINTGMSEEAIEQRVEAEKTAWGYDERVAEVAGITRLQDHQAESLLKELLEILEQTSVGPITMGGVGVGGLQMDVEGLPINVNLRAGEIHEIKVEKAKIYEAQKDAVMLNAERVYTFREYLRELSHIEGAFGVGREEAHKSYQKLVAAAIYNITDIKKVRRSSNTYTAKNGEMDIELEVEGGRVVAAYGIIEEMGVKEEIFSGNKPEGQLRDITPMGGGRGMVGDGVAYRIGTLIGIDGRTQIRMPIGLPDAADNWVIIDDEFTRNIKVRADIDEGKGMRQKTFLIKENRESNNIEYLKIDKKEY